MKNHTLVTLDKFAPVSCGVGAFIGTIIGFDRHFPLLYIFSAIRPWNFFAAFFIYSCVLSLFAYFSCACVHGRDKHILFSWGSLGGAVGYITGMFASLVFFMVFEVAVLIIPPIFSAAFSYRFHRGKPEITSDDTIEKGHRTRDIKLPRESLRPIPKKFLFEYASNETCPACSYEFTASTIFEQGTKTAIISCPRCHHTIGKKITKKTLANSKEL